MRCLKIAKYLREFGWEPVIFTADNAAYQFLDPTNEKDVPKGLEIIRVPIVEPINAFKFLSGRKQNVPVQNITANSAKKKRFIDKLGMWIRGNFFIPDARFLWIKPSVSFLTKYLEENPVAAIFTDGPPHTNTVIGLQVAKRFKLPWLADFQDPWTQVDYYKELYIGKRADRKHKQLEKAVFETAQKITIASPTWKSDLEAIGADNVDVLYYGYDEADFKDFNAIDNDHFTIVHAGLLGSDRNPEAFFEALGGLLQATPELKDKIKLILAGEVDLSVQNCIEQNGLKEITTYSGMISRQAVYDLYAAASLLILPINKASNAKGRIPGKLFELLRTAKPILVFGPPDGDVKKIVEDKKRGISFPYEAHNLIHTYLQKAIFKNEFENFEPENEVSEFSNFELTQQVAKILDEITA